MPTLLAGHRAALGAVQEAAALAAAAATMHPILLWCAPSIALITSVLTCVSQIVSVCLETLHCSREAGFPLGQTVSESLFWDASQIFRAQRLCWLASAAHIGAVHCLTKAWAVSVPAA